MIIDGAFSSYLAQLRGRYSLTGNVLLIEPPQFLFEAYSRRVILARGFYSFPPTGLAFLRNAIQRPGLTVDIFDLNLRVLQETFDNPDFVIEDWPRLLDEALAKRDYSVVGLTGMSILDDPSKSTFFVSAILRHLRQKDRHILLGGGSYLSSEYEFYLSEGLCDVVVTGEGEVRGKYIFDHLYGESSDLPPQSGIYYAAGGKAVETTGTATPVDLSVDIAERMHELPFEDYHRYGSLNPFSRMAGLDTRFGVMQLNRGCRANCKFCGLSDYMGRGVRQRSIDAVLAEIRHQVVERGVRFIDVLDDDFAGTGPCRPGLEKLMHGLAELRRDYGISWSATNGLVAASIDGPLLDLMKEAGCIGFRIGVESGNPDMLKLLRRPSNLATLRRLSSLLKERPEFTAVGNYIVGLLGTETFGQMMETFDFAQELELDWNGFTAFQYTNKDGKEQRDKEGAQSGFVPSRDSSHRPASELANVISGREIFDLPPDIVPSRDQVRQIWFTFNLYVNYINNKNLQRGGRPEKFVRWLEAVLVGYFGNPYMPLFAGLGRMLLGDRDMALAHLETARYNLEQSDYWRQRFLQFGLDQVAQSFPQSAEEVHCVLEHLRDRNAPRPGITAIRPARDFSDEESRWRD